MATFLMDAFSACLGVSALAAVFLLLRPALARRYTARWRCLVFLLLALRLVIPVRLHLAESLLTVEMPRRVVYQQSQQGAPSGEEMSGTAAANPVRLGQADISGGQAASSLGTTAGLAPGQPRPEAPAPGLDAPALPAVALTALDFAVMVWVCGALGCAAVGSVGYLVSRRRILNSAVPAPAADQECRALAAQMKLRRQVPVLQSAEVNGPMLLGVFRPCILLPMQGCPANELSFILRHELVHDRRGDVPRKLLFSAVCWLYWFDPVVWLMRAAAEADIEQACDEAVIADRDAAFRLAYSQSVVHALRPGTPLLGSTAFTGGKKTIRRRIVEIFNTAPKRAGKAALAAMLALTVLASTLVACTVAPQQAAAPADSLSFDTVPEQAMELVRWCEKAGGYDWPANRIDPDADMAATVTIGWLNETGQMESMRPQATGGQEFTDYYDIPADLMEDCLRFFAGEEHHYAREKYGPMRLALDYVQTDIELSLADVQTSPDGTKLTLTFDRSYPGAQMRPVTYTFEKTVAETVPATLASQYEPGDAVWQLRGIENGVYVSSKEPVTVEIATPKQLVEFAKSCNAGEGLEIGNTYLLTADLDMTGVALEPIGRCESSLTYDERVASYNGFNGVFDGQGHTITGLSIGDETVRQEDWADYRGMFSCIGPKGVVKNLTITDAVITASTDPQIQSYAGILAGRCYGRIENCQVTGTVHGKVGAGGMVGELVGWVGYRHGKANEILPAEAIDCTADVTVSGCQSVGGFAGTIMQATVTRCTTLGRVIGEDGDDSHSALSYPAQVGGFTGYGNEATFTDCRVKTSLVIQASGSWIGYAIGGIDGGSAANFGYDPTKKGNWQLIDVINGTDATEKAMQRFEFVPLP